MGKTVGGAFGRVRGKVGDAIGASWKGISIVRQMPLSVANPRTIAQMTQRNKFAQVVAVARELLADLIHTYWDPFSKYMSGYNAFIKANIDAFNSEGLLYPDQFYSGRGVLKGVSGLSATSDSAQRNIELFWTDNSGEGDALESDKAVVVWYNETQNYWDFFATAQTRSAGSLEVEEFRISAGDTIHVYMFFARPDISKISDSSYATCVVA